MVFFLQVFHGKISCFPHGHDSGNIQCSGAPSPFLVTAMLHGTHSRPPPDVKCTCSFRRMELVTGYGKIITVYFIYIDGNLPHGLYAVYVKGNTPLLQKCPYLFDGEENPCLVVGVHHRNNGSIIVNRFEQIVEIKITPGVNGHIGYPVSLALKLQAEIQYSRMLNPGGYHVPLVLMVTESSHYCQVIALGCTAGKDNLVIVVGAKHAAHTVPGPLHVITHIPAKIMHA